MLVFLDDSGDPGFKVGKGSSPCFVIALVIFDDPLQAEKCAVAIKELRRSLGYGDTHEFRFNKCSKPDRLAFLARVSTFQFRVRAIVMNKSRIYGVELRRSKESFYNYTIKMVLKHSRGTIRNARLKLDGHGDRSLRRQLLVYLRRELPGRRGQPSVVADLRFVDSRENVLIQLADMVAGAIRRCADGEKDDGPAYREAIKTRLEEVWNFGA